MKILLTACLVLLGMFGGDARAQTIDPADYLGEEMDMTAMGVGSEPALRKLRLLPADQQVQVVETMVRKVKAISSTPIAASTGDEGYIRLTGVILIEIGTDEQIIQAFGALENFGSAEPDAAEFLASCKGSGGVEIIRKLAEKRLPELASAIDPKNQEEKARSNDVLNPFCHLLLSLEGAKNPEGPRAAKSLRDQVAARYPSKNGQYLVSLLDEEMADVRSRTEKNRSTPEPLPPNGDSDPVKVPEADPVVPPPSPNAPATKPTSSTPDEEPTSSLPRSIVIVLLMAAFGSLWLLLKKRK